MTSESDPGDEFEPAVIDGIEHPDPDAPVGHPSREISDISEVKKWTENGRGVTDSVARKIANDDRIVKANGPGLYRFKPTEFLSDVDGICEYVKGWDHHCRVEAGNELWQPVEEDESGNSETTDNS